MPSPCRPPECGELFGGEFVAPCAGVGDPYAQLHGHRFRLAVDRDLFDVPARHRPACDFPFYPLREGRQAALEGLFRLARARFRRALRRRVGRRRLGGCHSPRRQSFLLLGGQLCPGACLALPCEPFADVVALEQDARLDGWQDAVGVDEVGEDAVGALPAEWPGVVPALIDGSQLRGPNSSRASAVMMSGILMPTAVPAAGGIVMKVPSALASSRVRVKTKGP